MRNEFLFCQALFIQRRRFTSDSVFFHFSESSAAHPDGIRLPEIHGHDRAPNLRPFRNSDHRATFLDSISCHMSPYRTDEKWQKEQWALRDLLNWAEIRSNRRETQIVSR
jgi:hypothetical protein